MLQVKLLRIVGLVSYGIYLSHMFIIWIILDLINISELLLLLLTFILSLVLAVLMYTYIERPPYKLYQWIKNILDI